MAIKRDAEGKIIPRKRPVRRLGGNPIEGATARAPQSEATEAAEPVAEDARALVERGETTALVDGRKPLTDSRGPLAPYMCGAWLRGHKGELRCRKSKLMGAKRCALHGSATAKARDRAHETILLASYPAARKLRSILDDPDAPYSAVIAAARDLLDRADLAGKSTVEVEMPAFVETMQRAMKIRRMSPADDDRTFDKYSAVEAGTVDDVVDAEVVEPGQDPKPIEFCAPVRTPVDFGADVPKVNSSDTPPERVAERTPGYVRPGGERRSATTMRR